MIIISCRFVPPGEYNGIYVYVIWNLAACRNTKDYNTPMLTEIKGNLNIRIHGDITGDRCGLGCEKGSVMPLKGCKRCAKER